MLNFRIGLKAHKQWETHTVLIQKCQLYSLTQWVNAYKFCGHWLAQKCVCVCVYVWQWTPSNEQMSAAANWHNLPKILCRKLSCQKKKCFWNDCLIQLKNTSNWVFTYMPHFNAPVTCFPNVCFDNIWIKNCCHDAVLISATPDNKILHTTLFLWMSTNETSATCRHWEDKLRGRREVCLSRNCHPLLRVICRKRARNASYERETGHCAGFLH